MSNPGPDADDEWRAALIDQTVPGVVLLERIGAGGFAAVYRGRQTSVGREVAVKIIDRVLDGQRELEDYDREATVTARLSVHPGIVTVHDAGTDAAGRPYMLMELCRRGSIEDHLRSAGPLTAEQVARVGIVVADALDAAHRAGVWHRDVKPGNILINAHGEPALSDFGIAAIIDGQGRAGADRAFTPAYAPPEVRGGAPSSAVSDVYSLGLSLYAMLTRSQPRDGTLDPATPGWTVFRGEHPLLADVIERATHSDPAARIPTAALMADELRRAVVAAVPAAPHALERTMRPRGRRALTVFLSLLAIGAALGGLLVVEGLLRDDASVDVAIGSCWDVSSAAPQSVACDTAGSWIAYAVGEHSVPVADVVAGSPDPAVEAACTPENLAANAPTVAAAQTRVLTFRHPGGGAHFACIARST